MGRKKCCVCGRTKKKRYHKVCDMIELKSYLEVTNDSKYVCDGCRLKSYRNKNMASTNNEVCLQKLTQCTLYFHQCTH